MKRIMCLLISILGIVFITGCSKKEELALNMTPSVAPSVTLLPTPGSTGLSTSFPTFTPTSEPTTTPTPVPTCTPTLTPTPVPTSTPTLTPTPAPTSAPTLTPTPVPTCTPTLTPTPAPTSAPTPTPTPILAEGEILLCEENFPDNAFRNLLAEVVDLDGNGILTLEEREALTSLRNNTYDREDELKYEEVEYYCVFSAYNEYDRKMFYWANRIASLEGIQYFPKLKYICLEAGVNREWEFDSKDISEFSSIKELRLENMPELENVQIISPDLTDIKISNTPNLRYLYLFSENDTCAVTFGEKTLDKLQYLGYHLTASLELNGLADLKYLSLSKCTSLSINECDQLYSIDFGPDIFIETLDLSTCRNLHAIHIWDYSYSKSQKTSEIKNFVFYSPDVEVSVPEW